MTNPTNETKKEEKTTIELLKDVKLRATIERKLATFVAMVAGFGWATALVAILADALEPLQLFALCVGVSFLTTLVWVKDPKNGWDFVIEILKDKERVEKLTKNMKDVGHALEDMFDHLNHSKEIKTSEALDELIRTLNSEPLKGKCKKCQRGFKVMTNKPELAVLDLCEDCGIKERKSNSAGSQSA